jgi:hypothetical protein
MLSVVAATLTPQIISKLRADFLVLFKAGKGQDPDVIGINETPLQFGFYVRWFVWWG